MDTNEMQIVESFELLMLHMLRLLRLHKLFQMYTSFMSKSSIILSISLKSISCTTQLTGICRLLHFQLIDDIGWIFPLFLPHFSFHAKYDSFIFTFNWLKSLKSMLYLFKTSNFLLLHYTQEIELDCVMSD